MEEGRVEGKHEANTETAQRLLAMGAQKASEPEEEKEGLVDRAKNFFGNLFD